MGRCSGYVRCLWVFVVFGCGWFPWGGGGGGGGNSDLACCSASLMILGVCLYVTRNSSRVSMAKVFFVLDL